VYLGPGALPDPNNYYRTDKNKYHLKSAEISASLNETARQAATNLCDDLPGSFCLLSGFQPMFDWISAPFTEAQGSVSQAWR
ncbi:MAG: hypothetical protein LUD84_00390, partial [Clostridiales bacterium]|nr:hypothetical protein [Clostridiales bacterium]